jgi:simple sugar transport system ATP-binding protein
VIRPAAIGEKMAVIEVAGATKLYGGVPAVDGVDFTLYGGEVHGLLGENGAGKSTLAKSIAGVVVLTSGEMRIDGVIVHPSSPRQALELGIAMVYQESSLVPTTTVAQNLYLGQERFYNSIGGVNVAAQRVLQSLSFEVEASALVGDLGAAKRQMVEIARAVLHRAKVIIFDEPTTSLTPEEKRHFFKLVNRLKAQGVAILFITHAIEDALEHCDRITILRDGRHVATDDARKIDLKSVVRAMIGRDLSQTMYGQKKTYCRAPGERVLSVYNLRMNRATAAAVSNNTFSISSGQVTGVFGLVGAGRTETFKIVAGLLKRNFVHGGEVMVRRRPRRYSSPSEAVGDGIAYITEDRKVEGFFQTMTSAGNIYVGLLAKLGRRKEWLSGREQRQIGETWMSRLKVRATSREARVVELSGGNQQKVVIARSLVQNPEIVIFDEPTKGVDVGAIAEIHALINQLADEGKAVVVISSYLPEVLTLSDRVLVARAGKIVEEFSGTDATEENIMYAAIH